MKLARYRKMIWGFTGLVAICVLVWFGKLDAASFAGCFSILNAGFFGGNAAEWFASRKKTERKFARQNSDTSKDTLEIPYGLDVESEVETTAWDDDV